MIEKIKEIIKKIVSGAKVLWNTLGRIDNIELPLPESLKSKSGDVVAARVMNDLKNYDQTVQSRVKVTRKPGTADTALRNGNDKLKGRGEGRGKRPRIGFEMIKD